MALENTHQKGDFVTVLADGLFHLEVAEGTEGAKLREYKTSKGEEKSKLELTYQSLTGFIQSIGFFEGEFGKSLNIEIKDDKVYTVSLNTKNNFGEDMMKKFPNVDFKKRVTLKPYSFEDDKGKTRRGITIYQEDEKIAGYFYDGEKSINDIPTPEGDTSTYDTDDWVSFYTTQRKFLVKFTEENTIPRLETEKGSQEDEKGSGETNDIAF